MISRILIFAFLFLHCCKRENEAHETTANSERLAAKKQLYCDLSADLIAKRNYVVGKCDGLLFASLRGIGCGDTDISEFQDQDGRWFRDREHACFVPDSLENESDSSISKDMILGAMSHMWYSENTEQIDKTIAYGQSHDWVMGQAKDDETLASKCLLSPTLVSILIDIQKKNGSLRASVSTDAIGINTGFRAHLDVIHILLSGSVYNGLTDSEVQTLKAQADRQPHNALYQAAAAFYDDGDQTKAQELLLDESRFPADKLPTSKEFCSDYLWTDDEGPNDWDPCPDRDEVYDGTDFIVAATVSEGKYLKKGE
jgi:hypothetical protein